MMADDKPKPGRPKVELDIDLLAKLCAIQCTKIECAAVLGISIQSILRRLDEMTGETFEDFYEHHSSEGKVSLRRAQFKTALGTPASAGVKEKAPNLVMQIWLGKQYLNQKDRQETTGPDGGPLEMTVTYRMAKAKPAKSK